MTTINNIAKEVNEKGDGLSSFEEEWYLKRLDKPVTEIKKLNTVRKK